MLGTAVGGEDAPAVFTNAAPESVRSAPVALLVDLGTGQTLYEREADRRFIPASITKIMSAYVAFELIEAGKLRPKQQFTMSDAAFEEWYRKGSTMFLNPENPVSVDVLLRGITGVSANDAAIVLAEGAAGSVPGWTALMNSHAAALGMQNSHFGTPNGWPDSGKTFTTARDLQTLSRAMIDRHPKKFARYFGQSGFAYNGVTQANHDPISGKVPGADGIKTGFTRQAGFGFVGTAIRDGRRLLMVVGGIESPQPRAAMSRDLIEWGFQAFTSASLYDAKMQIGYARVQDGMAGSIPLVTPEVIKVDLANGSPSKIQLSIRYEGPLRAPVRRGESVAELEIAVEGMASFRVPLLAGEDIPQANLGKRLANGLAGILE